MRSVEWHEIYDPATDKYTFLAGMRGSTGTQPFVGQRDHMGVAVVDGKIHAIAGRMDSYDFNTSLNAVYDPKTDGWSFRAPLPTARSGPSCVYINGKIVVFGGEATGRVFGTNEIYDPKTDSVGSRHADGDPAPRPPRRDLRGDRQHGARARRRPGSRRQRAGRLSRRLHLRLRGQRRRLACRLRPLYDRGVVPCLSTAMSRQFFSRYPQNSSRPGREFGCFAAPRRSAGHWQPVCADVSPRRET